MPETQRQRRWWRPRFSLRTLVVVLTVICLYFGCWTATKRAGTARVEGILEANFEVSSETSSPLPFVVSVQANELDTHLEGLLLLRRLERRHYFWLPGFAWQLPGGFTDFIERCEACWHVWTQTPHRVHGGVI